MTKIAILGRWFYPRRGAEQSIYELYHRLKQDYTVRLFGFVETINHDLENDHVLMELPQTNRQSGYRQIYGDFIGDLAMAANFRKELTDFQPELIVAQHQLVYLAHWMKARYSIPYIAIIHDNTFLIPDENISGKVLLKKLYWSSYRKWWKFINNRVLSNADITITVSQFTQHIHKEYYPALDSVVIHPFISDPDHRVESTGEHILHVGPTKSKGIDVTLEVANSMKDLDFLIVGDATNREILDKMDSLTNVTYAGYIDDIRTAFRETRVVLQPSRDEAFGMVPIEAGFSGIPTIAAGTAGLPESVGSNRCLVESYNVEDYIATIERVIDNYDEYSIAARRNAMNKRAEVQYEKFIKLLRENKLVETE